MYIFKNGNVLDISYDNDDIRIDEYGLYINKGGKDNNFVEDIFNGKKTVETRSINSANIINKKIQVGDRIAIIEKGEIVGYATISEIINYKNKEDFKKHYKEHLVNADDEKYGWKDGKVGYRLTNVHRIPPKKISKANHPMGIREL